LEKFDVIVVGAGTAGCLAAKTIAEAGLKVCLVERKRKEEIGEKVCGDALGEHHLKALGLEKPQSGELEKRIEGIQIYSPDQNTIFTIWAVGSEKGSRQGRHSTGFNTVFGTHTRERVRNWDLGEKLEGQDCAVEKQGCCGRQRLHGGGSAQVACRDGHRKGSCE
jgi:choline dehydrogenase-like flavoprotein